MGQHIIYGTNHKKSSYEKTHNCFFLLLNMARPARFERATAWFVAYYHNEIFVINFKDLPRSLVPLTLMGKYANVSTLSDITSCNGTVIHANNWITNDNREAMKVKILGFKLNLAKNISIGEFYQELESVEGKEISVQGKTHVLLTDIVDKYICGLILTYKTNKKSLATEKDSNGDLVVNKSTLKPGEHGTEVSIFCINPNSMRGMFYNYSGSASPTGLQEFFRKQHRRLKDSKVKDYKNELTNFGTKPVSNIGKKLLDNFKGDLHLTILVTPSDLNDLLGRYKEIHNVVLHSDSALDDAGIFTPLDPLSTKAHITIDFDKKRPMQQIREHISNIFSPFSTWRKTQTLRLIGLSHSGEGLTLAVGDNQEHFGLIDYDDYVELLPASKWKDYKDCSALRKILTECSQLTEIFGPNPNDGWKLISAKDMNSEVININTSTEEESA